MFQFHSHTLFILESIMRGKNNAVIKKRQGILIPCFMEKKMKYLNLALAIIFITTVSCYIKFEDSFKMKPGTVNLSGLNCEYDDYNATVVTYQCNSYNIMYSTKYKSKGKDFDIFSGNIQFWIYKSDSSNISSKRGSEITSMNSDSNELGPIYIDYYKCFASDRKIDATDLTNDLNIFIDYYFNGVSLFGGNTPNYDEAYPCYDRENKILYYCTNKDGDFNIYQCKNDSTSDLITWLKNPEIAIKSTPVNILNSPKDDKCPYIFGDYIYFVSDRDGTMGGFDIYYSKRDETGEFSTPVNAGGPINTSHDEYRVSCYYYYNPSSISESPDFLIYSSNRPGGKGGFDLYLSVIKEIKIKEPR